MELKLKTIYYITKTELIETKSYSCVVCLKLLKNHNGVKNHMKIHVREVMFRWSLYEDIYSERYPNETCANPLWKETHVCDVWLNIFSQEDHINKNRNHSKFVIWEKSCIFRKKFFFSCKSEIINVLWMYRHICMV